MTEHNETIPTENNRATVSPFLKYLTYLLWVLFIIGLLSVGIFMWALVNAKMGFSELPTFEQLENPENKLSSEIYAADGNMIGKFFIENRSNIRYEQLPQHLVNCLVSVEDRRFYDHSGIDFKGLVTAVYRTMRGSTSGASTISQQLARNLFHERDKSSKLKAIVQKLKEWVIALRLERSYTKSEILTMYLNTVPFSHNAHGIKAASKTYFNKEPEDLDLQEGAVLIGMLKGSTLYNPVRNPNNSLKRRNIAIGQMEKYGYLTEEARDSLYRTELVVNPSYEDHNEGLATYFREEVKKFAKEWSKKNTKLDGTAYNIFQDGLKIYTTIDSRMQQYAEEAVAAHMPELQEQFYTHWNDVKRREPWHDTKDFIQRAIKRSERYRVMKRVNKQSDFEIDQAFYKEKFPMKVFDWKRGEIDTVMTPVDSIRHRKMFLHTGFLAMAPSGDIKAWVGGINHKHFKYDNVQESSKRQVGSTFKPFVYTVAIQNGWSPCHKLPNVPITFVPGIDPVQDPWSPDNATTKYNGEIMTLRFALAKSINRITARLMKEVGPQPVVALVERMGIEEGTVPPYPSICLGTPDISLFEMVGAYGTFMNRGVYTRPRYITRIEDKNGREIADFPHERKEVLSEEDAYIMLNLLQGVTEQGTGVRLRYKYGFEGDIAGKTGTTNDQSDGWYMGITPQLVAGVWTGGDEKAIRFDDLSLGGGANMALPVWGEFMQRVYADKDLMIDPDAKFEVPAYQLSVELDCSRYELQEQLELLEQLKEGDGVLEDEDEELIGFE